jgi:D-alanyl-lipoteichoic acid acyltransferase DltB (MBOAT superfamily)
MGHFIQLTSAHKKKYLLIGLIFPLSVLFILKYFNFFISDVLKIELQNTIFAKIILPIGISFYTFESLSYTIDIYRKQFKPTRSFIDYLTFIAFFPKLVAGPIMRAHELLPQLTKLRKRPSYRNIEMAIFLISWGLFKKLVFADNLGHLVDRCRENINNAGVGLILAIAFYYQIYFVI